MCTYSKLLLLGYSNNLWSNIFHDFHIQNIIYASTQKSSSWNSVLSHTTSTESLDYASIFQVPPTFPLSNPLCKTLLSYTPTFSFGFVNGTYRFDCYTAGKVFLYRISQSSCEHTHEFEVFDVLPSYIRPSGGLILTSSSLYFIFYLCIYNEIFSIIF